MERQKPFENILDEEDMQEAKKFIKGASVQQKHQLHRFIDMCLQREE